MRARRPAAVRAPRQGPAGRALSEKLRGRERAGGRSLEALEKRRLYQCPSAALPCKTGSSGSSVDKFRGGSKPHGYWLSGTADLRQVCHAIRNLTTPSTRAVA